jgi:hypothetical protein
LNWRRYAPYLRSLLIVAAICTGLRVFVSRVTLHYPMEHWLFWVYAKIWGWMSLFVAAIVSSGVSLLELTMPKTLPLRERLVLAAPVGTLAFFVVMFGGGLLGLYGTPFSIAMPLVLVFAGAPLTVRRLRPAVRKLVAMRRRPRPPRPLWFWPILAFGMGGLGLTYFAILSPRNIAFDSTFYHLGLAQQYATEQAIRPFVEGWLPGALPQLASVLYTWCLMLPGFDLGGHVLCASHVEFVLFLWTLAAIPVLVRWLVPGSRSSLSWAAIYLFPGILLYDMSLTTAADHIAAMFAIPAFLALRRTYRDFNPRYCGLLAAMVAGAILTKYQGMYILAFPALVLVVNALSIWLLPSRRRAVHWRTPLIGLAVAAGVGLVITTPHWVKNWVWYGDPLFPYLHRHFPPTRWAPEAGELFETWQHWQLKKWTLPELPFVPRAKLAAEMLKEFSFEPHTWPKFHGKVPVFGSLFTLSTLILPFVRRSGRTWQVMIATYLGIFIWAWTMFQDRYLQLLVPWMAVVVAATIALVWRDSRLARGALLLLIGAQVVWGGDVYFIPAHALNHAAPTRTTPDMIIRGFKKDYDKRLDLRGAMFKIGKAKELPPDAKILLHESNPRLGLLRPIVADAAGWQFGLRYELFESSGALHDKLVEMGITHVVGRAGKSRAFDSVGADLRYFDYATHETKTIKRFDEWALYEVPAKRPTRERNDMVAYYACRAAYEPGLFALSDLSVRDRQLTGRKFERLPAREPATKDVETNRAIVNKADYLVVGRKCKITLAPEMIGDFVRLVTRGDETLYVRQRPPTAPRKPALPTSKGEAGKREAGGKAGASGKRPLGDDEDDASDAEEALPSDG